MTMPPLLIPYAGTSGWTGSDTSRERAERNDSDGTTKRRQDQVYEAVRAAADSGVTAYELCQHLNLPTNSVAPSLTNLHHEGCIARLKERRGRHEVYVLPDHVGDRPVAPYRGRRALSKTEQAAVAHVKAYLDTPDLDSDEVRTLVAALEKRS